MLLEKSSASKINVNMILNPDILKTFQYKFLFPVKKDAKKSI